MNQPVRVAVNGASGRMGRALLELLRDDPRFVLAHAVVAPGSAEDGMPVFAGQGDGLAFASHWNAAPALDVVVDFSGAAGLSAALDHCLASRCALVTGTTGLDDALESRLNEASRHIAVLRAANFSLGVAVLRRLLGEAARMLPDWDLEILEAHHGRKLDAPSGTALALGEAAAEARGVSLNDRAVIERGGQRQAGSIGFAVLRGGDIVGEHEAWLIGQGERVELNHRASDRRIFARGALQAAYWLSSRPAGRWRIDDVIAPSGD